MYVHCTLYSNTPLYIYRRKYESWFSYFSYKNHMIMLRIFYLLIFGLNNKWKKSKKYKMQIVSDKFEKHLCENFNPWNFCPHFWGTVQKVNFPDRSLFVINRIRPSVSANSRYIYLDKIGSFFNLGWFLAITYSP